MLQPVRRESSPIWIAPVIAIAKLPLESVAATDATVGQWSSQGVSHDPDIKTAQGDRHRFLHAGGDRCRLRCRCLLRAAVSPRIGRAPRGVAPRGGPRLPAP